MSEKPQVEEGVEAILSAGETVGAKVIPALVLGTDKGRTLTVGLERPDFLGLVAHVRPAVIYLWVEEFEARTLAIATLEDGEHREAGGAEGEVDPEIVTEIRFKSLVKRWRAHDRQKSRFAASFMVHGILHTTIESEAWLGQFESEVDQLAVELSQEEDDEQSKLNAAEARDLREKAGRLAADPMFTAPKGSRAKREYLASDLFPGLDDHTISWIVEEAEKIEWLQAGRRNV
jgi:hypothetical protein